MRTKRLRIFAGPNGSGKSVLYEYLLSQQYLVGTCLVKSTLNTYSVKNH